LVSPIAGGSLPLNHRACRTGGAGADPGLDSSPPSIEMSPPSKLCGVVVSMLSERWTPSR
jgi:hypothetical protein